MKLIFWVPIILLLTFITCEIYGQDLELGFRVEAIGQQTESSNGKSNYALYPIPNTIKITFGISPVEKVMLDFRGGKKFMWDNFIGYQLESFVRYKFNEKFYLIGGLTYHMNDSWQSNTTSSRQVNIVMPSLGVGIKSWENSGFELMIQKANGKIIGWVRNDYGTYSESISTKLNWALKIGYFYAWEL